MYYNNNHTKQIDNWTRSYPCDEKYFLLEASFVNYAHGETVNVPICFKLFSSTGNLCRKLCMSQTCKKGYYKLLVSLYMIYVNTFLHSR